MANSCSASLKLTIPVLVDDMTDTVATAYGAWPDRMFILSPDGKVVFAGARGPAGFKVDEMEQALEKLLAASR